MGRFPKVVPCLLAVALVLSAADLHGADEMATRETAKPAAQKPLIALARAGENRGDRGPLYHQILQEAFLATAREEFGAATYDGTLREPTPQSSTHNVSTWEVIANFDPRRPNFELILNRRPGENSKRTWKHKLSIETPRDDGMEKEAARAEQAMHREFFDALRADGLTPRPHAWHEAAAAPKEVEPLLCNFCLPAQFDAIRKMHAQIDEDGELPERLAALARAYANLGLLTEHLWTNSTKALTARSLVYAERLCAKQPESAAALRCRGYVRALAGRQHTALVDFQGARALAEKDHAAAPTWGVLAEALCKFDAKTLKEDLEKPYQPLARWLYYLALEPSELPSYLEDVANSVLEVTPDAYRPIDLLTNKGLWIQRTEGAKFGHLASRQFLYPDMAALDDLPPEVKAICLEAPAAEEQTYAEFAHRASLVSALRNADSTGQRGEPAWAALATLLEDVALVQVGRELLVNGDSEQLGLKAAMPLLKNHPYWVLLGLHSNDSLVLNAEVQAADKIGTVGLTINAGKLIDRLYWLKRPLWQKLGGGVLDRADDTFYDLWRWYEESREEYKDEIQSKLFVVAPNMPVAVGNQLMYAREAAGPHIEQWEKQYAAVPDFILRLGQYYREVGKFDDAIRILRQEVEAYPDRQGFSDLAETYLQTHCLAGWMARKRPMEMDHRRALPIHAMAAPGNC